MVFKLGKINILNDDLVSQIAAGEIIENPASVVKELVENSIDAKGNKIVISIVNGGISLIQVDDNGEGMDYESLNLALHRHATSKISSLKDLENIRTLGFRGEALPSIASVSKLLISSRIKSSSEGNFINVYDNKVENGVIGRPVGTTVKVEDLFYNTPARRKFLNSYKKETASIIDMITKLALSRPDISFRLIDSGKTILQSPGIGGLSNTISALFNREISNNLIEIDSDFEGIQIKGFIGNQILSRSNRNSQFIFVNGRFTVSKMISTIIEKAYDTLLGINKYPVFFLNLSIDPSLIDVNVHPKKISIRFLYPKIIMDGFYKAAIEKLGTIKNPFILLSHDDNLPATFNNRGINGYFNEQYDFGSLKMEMTPTNNFLKEVDVDTAYYSESKNSYTEGHHSYKILNQVFNTYIVLKKSDSILIIDQHAAHERILYDRLVKDLFDAPLLTQLLMPPLTYEYNYSEQLILKENIITFEKLGYTLEEFGGNTVIIRSSPVILGKAEGIDLFKEILNKLNGEKQIHMEDLKKHLLVTISCRKAIKAGDVLTVQESARLIEDLFNSSIPYTCPHGRPTILEMTQRELEKHFKRIQ